MRQKASLQLADSVPEPDVAVVAGTDDDYRDHHPTTAACVVEIAVDSLAVDRAKAALYAEEAAGEYWIVRAGAGQVEVYRRPVDGIYCEWQLCRRGEVIEGVVVTGGNVAVDSLFT